MREIAFDTETTGFDPYAGDRLVEIGCVEIVNKVRTGKTFHIYINPEREVPEDAAKVHGLTYERLKSEPKFKEIADDFLEFVGDSNLVIHNAAFDMKFINAELAWAKKETIPFDRAVDTLLIARKKFPGQKNNLDSLSKRLGVDTSARVLHGALLDAEILADVYLELCGGRSLKFSFDKETNIENATSGEVKEFKKFYEPRNFPLTEEEIVAHNEFISKIKNPIWLKE
ncbi:MAG: DNA polymerase III subunit epsilon [Alphaproteobacteria bacterium ADurb.Bin438]|nr:MAG: DNA polymerase III subunit epsilon [Alphaproteobacteria bacterium ADurb.Bin438]